MLPDAKASMQLRAELHAVEAECNMRLGQAGVSRAALERALAIARSDHSGRLWADLASVALSIWKGEASTEALELLQEAIAALERGGARDIARMYRIKLASMLRQLGRLEEAAQWMPDKREMHPVLERQWIEESARLHLASGRPEEAAADCRALAAFWETEPDGAPERAVVDSLLAQALLDTGDHQQAECLARQAAEILVPRQHPEAAACMITIALAAADEAAGHQAFRLIASHPMLSDAQKQRLTEAEQMRIERANVNRHEHEEVAG